MESGSATLLAAATTKNNGRKSFQISAKGSLVIRDCTDDGKCLTIENTGTKVRACRHYCCHYRLYRWR